jgi:hypothetical protein
LLFDLIQSIYPPIVIGYYDWEHLHATLTNIYPIVLPLLFTFYFSGTTIGNKQGFAMPPIIPIVLPLLFMLARRAIIQAPSAQCFFDNWRAAGVTRPFLPIEHPKAIVTIALTFSFKLLGKRYIVGNPLCLVRLAGQL